MRATLPLPIFCHLVPAGGPTPWLLPWLGVVLLLSCPDSGAVALPLLVTHLLK
jgi:hypothetical protein